MEQEIAESLSAENAGTGLHASAEALLTSVEGLLETRRELALLRGENFNLFWLLHLERNEDELHSRFIAELLNPRGSHEMGKAFLDLFLFHVGKTGWIKTGIATVQREKYIGPVVIDEENSEGGRIDIFVTDGDHHLSIENKIDAEEGDQQITRYCTYDRARNFVLFLTLDGKAAKTTEDNYSAISYPQHVLPWLEDCERRTADFPTLRQTIKQYLITVRELTGGLAMQGAESQIREAMKHHYKAAWAIRQHFDALRSAQVNELAREVKLRISEEARRQKLDLAGIEVEINEKEWGLFLRRESWGRDIRIGWEDDYLGIHSERLIEENWADDDHFQREFPKLTRKPSQGWFRWNYFENKGFFWSEEGLNELFDEFRRSERAQHLAGELVGLATYCDRKFCGESS